MLQRLQMRKKPRNIIQNLHTCTKEKDVDIIRNYILKQTNMYRHLHNVTPLVLDSDVSIVVTYAIRKGKKNKCPLVQN